MRVLLTGANGYVGRAARLALADAGHQVVAAVRSLDRLAEGRRSGAVAVGAVDGGTEWSAALSGVDAVLHLVSPPLAEADEAARRAEADRVIVGRHDPAGRAGAGGRGETVRVRQLAEGDG